MKRRPNGTFIPDPKPLANRFWSKVDRRGPDECWEWTGGKADTGYGMIWNNDIGRMESAHRLSLKLSGVDIDGMVACHRCDNRGCVNPGHLFVGTIQDNNQDKVNKGRQAKGSRMGNAKLTEEDVRCIRDVHQIGGVSIADMAHFFGVAWTTIYAVIERIQWDHVA